MANGRWDLDKVRLIVQALIAAIVLMGATILAIERIIDSGAVIALYGVAVGAVGGGAVGGIRPAAGITTQTWTDKPNGGTELRTERKG